MIPIVLHHGIFGFGQIQLGKLHLSYFHRIDRAIADRGHPVIIPRVHPTGGIERRARQLKETILRQLAALGRERDRVVIVAHSMGGLDARFMITHLGMADQVAALVTISTPHRGSPYADACLRTVGRRLGALRLFELLKVDVQAISDLTTDHCAHFNQQTPDAPGVRYYSISCARAWHLMPPFFMPSWRVVSQAEGDNDGLVSVKSAQWGQHLETWAADHLHAVGRRFAVEIRNRTGDIVPHYMKVMERLRADQLG